MNELTTNNVSQMLKELAHVKSFYEYLDGNAPATKAHKQDQEITSTMIKVIPFMEKDLKSKATLSMVEEYYDLKATYDLQGTENDKFKAPKIWFTLMVMCILEAYRRCLEEQAAVMNKKLKLREWGNVKSNI